MLNPSSADEHELDPSCTRARNYARRWGYGALVVTNLFGWRSTDPKALEKQSDPVGRGNDAAILDAARRSELVVCAWGNHGALGSRSSRVKALLRKSNVPLFALRVTSQGEPGHPLYLPGGLRPARWS